jgi:hypothetical protein
LFRWCAHALIVTPWSDHSNIPTPAPHSPGPKRVGRPPIFSQEMPTRLKRKRRADPGSAPRDPVFLAFFASWRENWFWLRPEAAMCPLCLCGESPFFKWE